MIDNLRRAVKHPRYLTVIGVFGDMWWCSRCNHSDVIGVRVHHSKTCLGGMQPIEWGPKAENRWLPGATERLYGKRRRPLTKR